jgi:sugar-specific transcriptional regulator TrmB
MYKLLEQIGLSKNEAKTYLALINLGESTATKIAKKAKIDRANTYDSLERLQIKGLASYVYKENVKHFEAANPNNLRRAIEEKELVLNKILPTLKLANSMSSKNDVNIHEGVKAFQNLLSNLLNYNKSILVYGIPLIAPELMKFFISHFHKKRIDKQICMKHIYNYDAEERINYLNTLEFTEAKHLPEKYAGFASTVICGEEVIITLWEKNFISIQIKNFEIAEIYGKYFEILWLQSN